MAATPNGKWSALSIHERIRAMNETLDSVEQQQQQQHTTTMTTTLGGSGGSNQEGGERHALLLVDEPASAAVTTMTTTTTTTGTPRRSSVVDIWRQREASGSVGESAAAVSSTLSPMPPTRTTTTTTTTLRNQQQPQQLWLNNASTGHLSSLLSSKLGDNIATAAAGMGGSSSPAAAAAAAAARTTAFHRFGLQDEPVPHDQQDESNHHDDDSGWQPQQQQQPDQPGYNDNHHNDNNNSSNERMLRKMMTQRGRPSHTSGSSSSKRGIASASPAPPPMPVRRGGGGATATAASSPPFPTPSLSSLKQQPAAAAEVSTMQHQLHHHHHHPTPPGTPPTTTAPDITIVPSPSNYSVASSAGSGRSSSTTTTTTSRSHATTTTGRNAKILQAWEQKLGGGGSNSNGLSQPYHPPDDGTSSSSSSLLWGSPIRKAAITTTSTTTTTPVINEGESNDKEGGQDLTIFSGRGIPSSPLTEQRRSVVEIWNNNKASSTTNSPKTTTIVTAARTTLTTKLVAPPTLPKSPRAVKVTSTVSSVSVEPTSSRPAVAPADMAAVEPKWKQHQPVPKWKEPVVSTFSSSSALFIDETTSSSIANLEIVSASSNVSNMSEASSANNSNRWTQLRRLDQTSSSPPQQLEPKTLLTTAAAAVPKWKTQPKAAAADFSSSTSSTIKKSTFGGSAPPPFSSFVPKQNSQSPSSLAAATTPKKYSFAARDMKSLPHQEDTTSILRVSDTTTAPSTPPASLPVVPQWKVQLKPVGTNAPPSNAGSATTNKSPWSKRQVSATGTVPLIKSQPSVLDRWKVNASSPSKVAVVPNWKKKTGVTATPSKQSSVPIAKTADVTVPQQQDEPTMSETEITSDDENVTMTVVPVNDATAATATAPVVPVKPGKITDRWLSQQSTKGVSTGNNNNNNIKPALAWAKPVAAASGQKLKEMSEPSVETAEASSVVSPLSPTASEMQDGKSESLSSPSQSPRGAPEKQQVRSTFDSHSDQDRSMIPSAIECDTTSASSPVAKKPTTTTLVSSPSSLLQKITAVSSPAVSRIVKEFGHRTPVATPRKNDRTFSEEKNSNSNNVSASSSLPPVTTDDDVDTAAEVVAKTGPAGTISTSALDISVPEQVSGLVKNLGSRTPSGKKRLSIADRWTVKVSSSASKSDSASKNQPEDEVAVDKDQHEDEAASDPVELIDDNELVEPGAESNPDSKDDAIEAHVIRDLGEQYDLSQGPTTLSSTPSLPRDVTDRWKKRVATQREESPGIQASVGDQDETPQSTLDYRIGNENESSMPGDDSLIQKLSFDSDTRISDVEVVLADSSQKDESFNSSLELHDESSLGIAGPQTDFVDNLGTAAVENEDVEIDVGTTRSTLAGRRARKLSKSRIQKPRNHLQDESKSEAGNQRRYPDFNRLVDRSRSMASSLSPTRHRTAASQSPPPVKSNRDDGLTPPRIPLARSLRPASAPRPKTDADNIPTNTCASPIDLITSWNQKLTSTQGSSRHEMKNAKAPAASVLPKSSGKVKKSNPIDQKTALNQRNKKNFAQLGRKHAVKRPTQYSEGPDEDSVEEELTQRLVQPDDASSQKLVNGVSPSKLQSFREVGSASPLDSRRFSSTPVMSNRRSSFRHPAEESFEQRAAPIAGETSTSRKIATEKATIKKRLNSRRRSRDYRIGNRSSILPSQSTSADASFGQESTIDHGSDYDAILLPDSATPSPTAASPDATIFPDSATPSPAIGSPESDQGLETTSSTVSSSSLLANKAERLLKERRRKSNDPDGDRAIEPQNNSNENDMDDFANRVRQGIPSHEDLSRPDEGYLAMNRPRSDDSSAQGARSLSSRYNVSSRFIDNEAESSVASSSLQDGGMSNEDSSCVLSADSTAASPAVPQNSNRRPRSKSANQSKRKGRPSKLGDNTSVASDSRSTNTSTQNAWDASRVSDIASLMSFDLKKFASAVDERVAVLRDFVGGPLPDGHSPPEQDFDMEMEDVAIEVEYVEDDASELGLANSQSGDELVRRGYV